MAYETFTAAFLGTMQVDAERSRLAIGGHEVAFHCDKFNTRILKNFEDVMGYEAGGELIYRMAETTTYDLLQDFCSNGGAEEFSALDVQGRLEALCELFKALAYGAIRVDEAGEERALFSSPTSYLAEGWLENKDRWHLDERSGPACHDVRGHLAAAMALATASPAGRFKVSETQCRAYNDAPACVFVAEVKS